MNSARSRHAWLAACCAALAALTARAGQSKFSRNHERLAGRQSRHQLRQDKFCRAIVLPIGNQSRERRRSYVQRN